MAHSTDNSLLIGAAVGSGISALAAEEGGADFLLAINAARFRNMGSPSIACMLPTHDSNAMALEFAVNEILPRAQLPVLLGINCWEPEQDLGALVAKIKALGFAGAVNFPSAMHYSQEMRQVLDAGGIGPKQEVKALSAVQQAGLRTLYYCGTRSQAQFAARAGLKDILFNYGWNVGGSLGHAPRISLEESSAIARDIGQLVKSISPQTNFYLEGGPIITADDLGFVAQHAPLDGYVGGSTLDRMPFESSVANRIAGYKSAKSARRSFNGQDEKLLSWGRTFGFAGQSDALLKFLRQFQTLIRAEHPFLAVLDRGANETAIVTALGVGSRRSTMLIDPRQVETPMQATRQLLGSQSNGVTTFGALVRDDVSDVILRNPHLMSAPAQRRLAGGLRSGAIPHPARRALLPITTRLVCVMPDGAGNATALEPDLQAVFDGWTVHFPSLRARVDDIMRLMDTKCTELNLGADRAPTISAAAAQVFRGHSWPGNEQELAAVVGDMAQTCGGKEVGQSDARTLIAKITRADDLPDAGVSEKQAIAEALWRNSFHKGNTAYALGISRKTLYNKMRKYGLSP